LRFWPTFFGARRHQHPSACPDHPWFAGLDFTEDWTTSKIGIWDRVLQADREAVADILEIGSHEGRSAVWFLNFFPRASITCIDQFGQADDAVERRFDANTAKFKARVRKIGGRSIPELDKLVEANEAFDLIYVDGNHGRDAVLIDTLLAWHMLRPGGVLIWDDYLWMVDKPRWVRPQEAIDTFLKLYRRKFVKLHRGYQVIVRRKMQRDKARHGPSAS
jgi:predicted O-methyltransferase YrrM